MNYLRCDGDITFSLEGFPLCASGWQVVSEEVLLSAIPIQQLFELLNSVFSTPSTTEIAVAFGSALTIPLIAYLASWGYQSVIKFMR